MTLAVIKTGGKQYLVKPGDEIEIEKIKGKKVGDQVAFDKILLLEKEKKVEIGDPFLKGVKVLAEILSLKKGKKITILKYKPKTRYKVKKGHRQPLMRVKIKDIISGP